MSRTTRTTANAACAPLAGAAVEIWQCDADGHYSEYAQPGFNGSGQTFLRGLQMTDAAGRVTFKTVYPGWYQGRATHVHVEVYVNGRSIKVTQIAFPEDVTALVYRSGVYSAHGQNPTTNRTDMVFSDGVSDELATLSGSVASGFSVAGLMTSSDLPPFFFHAPSMKRPSSLYMTPSLFGLFLVRRN